jgi:ATP-dependent Clp protease protease subunit
MSLIDKMKSNLALEKKALQLNYSFEWGVDIANRIIRISGDIDTGYFDFLDAALTELESESKGAITIRINCPGGSVYEALAMVGRIESCKRQIITEGYGHIMSAATLLLASGDKRKMSKRAHFMHHETYLGLEGKQSELEVEIRQLRAESDSWADAMEEMTGTDRNFWANTGVGTNAYFSPEECLELGIVDEIF